jgi:hypothetical protein
VLHLHKMLQHVKWRSVNKIYALYS